MTRRSPGARIEIFEGTAKISEREKTCLDMIPPAGISLSTAPFVWSDTKGYVHCSADLSGKKKTKKELKAIELANAQGEFFFYGS